MGPSGLMAFAAVLIAIHPVLDGNNDANNVNGGVNKKMSPGSLLLPDRWLVAWHKLELGLSRLLGGLVVKMRI